MPGIRKYTLACEHTFYVLCTARRWLEEDSYLLPIPRTDPSIQRWKIGAH